MRKRSLQRIGYKCDMTIYLAHEEYMCIQSRKMAAGLRLHLVFDEVLDFDTIACNLVRIKIHCKSSTDVRYVYGTMSDEYRQTLYASTYFNSHTGKFNYLC